MARASSRRQAGGRFRAQGRGSSGDGAAFPLFEALIDAQSVIGVWEQSLPSFDEDEPRALQEIDEQQRSRDELRRADGIGIEKSA
jgi:hypothetical protein